MHLIILCGFSQVCLVWICPGVPEMWSHLQVTSTSIKFIMGFQVPHQKGRLVRVGDRVDDFGQRKTVGPNSTLKQPLYCAMSNR
jgi:hypothetical protein